MALRGRIAVRPAAAHGRRDHGCMSYSSIADSRMNRGWKGEERLVAGMVGVAARIPDVVEVGRSLDVEEVDRSLDAEGVDHNHGVEEAVRSHRTAAEEDSLDRTLEEERRKVGRRVRGVVVRILLVVDEDDHSRRQHHCVRLLENHHHHRGALDRGNHLPKTFLLTCWDREREGVSKVSV